MERNLIYNSITLICNIIILILDIILSFQVKKEYHKTKSIQFNVLANEIEEDIIMDDIKHLEFNRIFKRFKDLIYTENNKMEFLISKKEKELIYINIKELEELKIFNIMELIIDNNDNNIPESLSDYMTKTDDINTNTNTINKPTTNNNNKITTFRFKFYRRYA